MIVMLAAGVIYAVLAARLRTSVQVAELAQQRGMIQDRDEAACEERNPALVLCGTRDTAGQRRLAMCLALYGKAKAARFEFAISSLSEMATNHHL